MCGRYAFFSPAEAVRNVFRVDARLNLEPRYNVCPTDRMPVIRLSRDGTERVVATARWGLVPAWAEDTRVAHKAINARAERVATANLYRSAFKRRRCLVPADGFYEWQPASKSSNTTLEKLAAGKKQPYYIHRADGGLLAFAGLWEIWTDPDGEIVDSYTIITTTPNATMAELHNRMPVILDPEDFDAWLDPTAGGEELLKPCPDEWLTTYPVSTYVSKARNEGRECIEPAAIRRQ